MKDASPQERWDRLIENNRKIDFVSNFEIHTLNCAQFSQHLGKWDFVKSQAFIFFVRTWIFPDNRSSVLAAWRRQPEFCDNDLEFWKAWTKKVSLDGNLFILIHSKELPSFQHRVSGLVISRKWPFPLLSRV